ncbi:glycoside hydrolase family 26 protein [Pontibacter chitinilyticus]|uniref:glycoside hydrolase family 26 protein n=1 Tax=Pontibacter chitinilyticus TaxID=2674989 RepID=UPI00321AD021
MNRISLLCLLSLCFMQVACAQTVPTSSKATAETKNLYQNLQRLSAKGVMFGHQDDLAYGVGWKYKKGRSDVKEAAGSYPAVLGSELGHLELGSAVNLDSVPFDQIRNFVQQTYAAGGVNTISWHLNNPLDPAKTSWDPMDSTIYRLFNDPAAMQRYQQWLDGVATFMKSLKGSKGELIPVIFRPFHEHTGGWFWWGRPHTSREDYVKLWRYTVDYLRLQNVNNLLYAYSTDRFTSREDYLDFYPGDRYVDLLGFDIYHRLPQDSSQTATSNAAFVQEARQMVETLRQVAQEKHKLYAVTETGLENIPMANWWTKTLLPTIKDSGLSYVLVWRNGDSAHYYAPYPGQHSAQDFKAFANSPQILLLNEVKDEHLYQSVPFKKKK